MVRAGRRDVRAERQPERVELVAEHRVDFFFVLYTIYITGLYFADATHSQIHMMVTSDLVWWVLSRRKGKISSFLLHERHLSVGVADSGHKALYIHHAWNDSII